jgi:ankyrin repeat protein
LKYINQIALDDQDNYGNTALMLACKNGRLYIVQELLKAEHQTYINLYKVNNDGRTALDHALNNHNRQIVHLLRARMSAPQSSIPLFFSNVYKIATNYFKPNNH